jgi:hypothetical protein
MAKEQTSIEPPAFPEMQATGFVPGTTNPTGSGLAVVLRLALTTAALLVLGCELTPTKPDVVFTLYKDRMKTGKLADARESLSDGSKALVEKLNAEYKLRQPPEELALLNILDPVTPPTVMKAEDTYALIQVRTLKGELRLVRMVRASAGAPWKLEMTEELKALEAFLEARQVLEMMREQAGEYAESWKAFNEQLGKMGVPEQPVPKLPPVKPPRPPKEKPAQEKHTPKRAR